MKLSSIIARVFEEIGAFIAGHVFENVLEGLGQVIE
jgi:hypothetical protein